MTIERELKKRSGDKCELCGSTDDLRTYEIPPVLTENVDKAIWICGKCDSEISNPGTEDHNHWRCLNDSMWSEIPAVQVMAWRMLTRMREEGWPQDLLDMLYLDEDNLEWAKANGDGEDDDSPKHIDSNGNVLKAGDSVVLIKDLNVKGGGFTAKRGTAVRNISLVADNPEHIEGKVEGQHIVILTKYVKK